MSLALISRLSRIVLPISRVSFHNSSTLYGLRIFDEKNVLQKPPEKFTKFEVFDLAPKFDLNTTELSKKFRSLQAQLHPDKFGPSKSPEEQQFSEQWSSLVNDSYQTLLKPLNRALYMLELFGKPLEEGSKSDNMELLSEIMELNEEVDELADAKEIAKLSERNKNVIQNFVRQINEAFAQNELETAQELIIKMKYYCNVQDKITEKEQVE